MRRIHYAWAVCLGCSLSLFAIIGLGINIFSVYQPYIVAQNHFTNAQGSLITTTRSLFALVSMLTVNQLCSRFGLRRVMTAGMGLMVLSCLCFGLADSFPFYCVAAALTGCAYCYGGMIPLSIVIGHWFRDRRSFAIGLASAGSGLSTIFAPALVTKTIEKFSMRTAFFLEGLFILLLGILVWVLVRDDPKDRGMSPYRLGGEEAPLPPLRQRPAGMTRTAWLSVLFAGLVIGGPTGPGFSHLTMLYTSCGYDSMFVAVMLSYFGLVLFIGKILCGQIFDTLGGRLANFYIFGVLIAGLILCCLAPLGGVILPFAAMTLMGLGLSISASPFAAWAADLQGDEGYESAVRSLTLSFALGMLLFGPVPGMLADLFHSYVPAYVLFTLLMVLCLFIVARAYEKAGAGRK